MTPRRELRGGPRRGVLVPDAREWRVLVDPVGSVVVEQPGGRVRSVAAPGEVARVVAVAGPDVARRLRGNLLRARRDEEVVSFLGDDDRVLLTLPLTTIHLGRPVADPAVLRASSGIADVALTLGLTLERATPDQVTAVNAARSTLTRGTTLDRLRRRRRLHLALFLVFLIAAFAGFPLAGFDDAAALVAVDVVMFVPAVVLTTTAWRRSRRALGVTAPEPGDRSVVPNVAAPGQWRWIRESQLQLGQDDVVLTRHFAQTWLPGPRRGGVVTCVLSEDAISFLDRHDAPLTVVESSTWVRGREDAATLAQACERAGIRFESRAVRDLPPGEASDVAPDFASLQQGLLFHQTSSLERGTLVVGSNILLAILSVGIGVANLAVITRPGADASLLPLNILAAVVGVSIFGTIVGIELRARRWHRRQMSTGARGGA